MGEPAERGGKAKRQGRSLDMMSVPRRRGMSPTYPGDCTGEVYDGFPLICFPDAAADLY